MEMPRELRVSVSISTASSYPDATHAMTLPFEHDRPYEEVLSNEKATAAQTGFQISHPNLINPHHLPLPSPPIQVCNNMRVCARCSLLTYLPTLHTHLLPPSTKKKIINGPS